jgi:hypothetical protein
MSDAVFSVSEEDHLLQVPVKMKAWPAAKAEKLIGKNDINGNSAVDQTVFMLLRS